MGGRENGHLIKIQTVFFAGAIGGKARLLGWMLGLITPELETIRAISAFPESEIYMATNGNSHKSVSVTFDLPDPDLSPHYHGEVGGTATWQSSAVNYPTFEIHFNGDNPSNGTRNAQFDGSSGNPVVLPLNTAGQFHYRIKQINADGTPKITGPHTMGVSPQGQFVIHGCSTCPPNGTN